MVAIVRPDGPLPSDLTAPEGRSRWDLSGLTSRVVHERTERAGAGGLLVTEGQGEPAVYADLEGGAPQDAERWLLPHRDGSISRMGARRTLELSRVQSGIFDELRIEAATVGIGWVDLPSGPRETILQRALLLRRAAGSRGFAPETLVHRWIDPRAGVVAEIEGPASEDGRARLSVSRVAYVEQVLAGAAMLKIYVDELDFPAFDKIGYGRDRGPGTTVASMTPDPNVTTIGQLIALDTWNFSGNTTGTPVASTTVPLDATQTCNTASCGYSFTGALLDREDVNYAAADPNLRVKINTVTEPEQRAGDFTIWLRAGAVKEGMAGSFGQGESRFCYVTDASGTRTRAPLWRFPNQDAGGWYMQPGDPQWSGGPGSTCQQNFFNEVCGGGGSFSRLYAKSCTGSNGSFHAGLQSGQVVKGGVVILPSGHTFNALLVRNVADFCIYLASGCSSLFKVDEVRTVNYIWQVPEIGTVVRLQSVQNANDTTSFTTLESTDVKFGLFPPRSIAISGATDTTISLSWDPGLDTSRINDYRIHWDTDSGSSTPYASSARCNTGPVTCAGTTATISGLSAGTTYFVTVTSLSSFQNPSTGVVTEYESLLFPTQISGDPSFVYPVEVQATTTGGVCIPSAAVANVTVDHAPGGVTICWDPASDPCLTGYRILEAASPESDAGFTTLATTGLATCWTGSPAGSFFLVVTEGTGGTGPWGHYGR